MKLHLMYVKVCKWTYHVSCVVLTAVLMKIQILMAVTSDRLVNGNTLLVNTYNNNNNNSNNNNIY